MKYDNSMRQGQLQAWLNATSALLTRPLGKVGGIIHNGIVKPTSFAVTLPMRFLSAGDEFLKTVSFRARRTSQIHSQIRKENNASLWSGYFKDKKAKQTITVKIISTDNKGLIVRPEGCEMDLPIKRSNIALNAPDQRQSRFTGGERIDCAILDLDFDKRKVTLSIKLLEELERAEALEKFGTTEGSGKSLPFSSLADDLKKKKDNKK